MNKFFKSLLILSVFILGFSVSENTFAKAKGGGSSSDLGSEYSFKDVFNKNGSQAKRHFSVALNYDLAYLHGEDIDGKYDLNQNGWGMAFELFPVNWVSFYVSFSDTYNKENDLFDKMNNQTVYFGSRVYFSFLYLGLGAAAITNSNTVYDDGTKDKSKNSWWGMYFQVGANFAIAKNLSFDTGVNILYDGHVAKDKEYVKSSSQGDFYLGLKYTI